MALTPLCSPTRLVGLALGVSSLAASFMNHRCCTSSAYWTGGLSAAPSHRYRSRALRLAPRQEQGEGDTDSQSTAVSEFEQTSGSVKAFVGGLTDLFVRFAGGDEDSEALSADTSAKASLSEAELEAGIRQEYAKNYLWTGDINEDLYEEDCNFTDPTLSFSGLSTYKRNVGSLQGVLDLFVRNSRSVLYSCELRQEDSCVQTRWRMVGDLRLPWGPTIDVVGRTTFSYDSSRGNRIFSYDEVWEMEAAEALMQIFRPGKRDSAPEQ
ncbi:unnamed protein product [Ectocarpus sp. 6 AP-2014]